MPIITVLKGRRFEREFSFDKDHLFLGREDDNDLVLPDGSISRVHAKFVRDPSGWSIVDLNSTNGVFVNNNKVMETPVKEGDVLVVGEYTIFLRSVASEGIRTASLVGAIDSTQSLKLLFGLTRKFKSEAAVQESLEAMLESVMDIFQAQRGFILLRDPTTGQLGDPRITRFAGDSDQHLPVSKTVANRVLEQQAPLLITDVEADDFAHEAPSISTDQVRSIICAPLMKPSGPARGVVYLDSQIKIRVFTEDDLTLLKEFLEHASHLLGASEEARRLKRANRNLTEITREVSRREHDTDSIVGSSSTMTELLGQLSDVAAEDVTALITGESGTGKELFAKAIHYRSRRATKPFVAVNLMALPKELIESELFGHEKGAFSGAVARKIGKFELAEGGTIFLDEVGELSLDIQVKLLRALEERSVVRIGGHEEVSLDIRLVSATNRDLDVEIKEGRFREDLYYRLNVFNIHLPALKDRREDLPGLVEHFLAHFNSKMGKAITGVESDAMSLIRAYDWPGNIRELKNVIERAFVVEKSSRIQVKSLPFNLVRDRVLAEDAADCEKLSPEATGPGSFEQAQGQFEKTFIVESLKKFGGNVTQTSKETGLPRRSLYRKLEKYGIDPKTVISSDSAEDDQRE